MKLRNSVFNLTLTNQQIGNLTLNVLENNVVLLNGNTYGQSGQLNVNIGTATVGQWPCPENGIDYRIRGVTQQPGENVNKMGLILDTVISCNPPGVIYHTTWDTPMNYNVKLAIVKNYNINNWKIYPDVVEEIPATKLHKIVKINKTWFSNVANAIRYRTGLNNKIKPSGFIDALTNGYSYPLEGNEYNAQTQWHCTYGTNNLKNVLSDVFNTYGPITDHVKQSFYICFNNEITDMTSMFEKCDVRDYPELLWCGPNVVTMRSAYYNSPNMIGTIPDISDSVVNMSATFTNCWNLTGPTKYGTNVTDYSWCYSNCFNLIPSTGFINAKTYGGMFSNCGNKNIKFDPPTFGNALNNMADCFNNTSVNIVAGTKSNNNIYIYDKKPYNVYIIPYDNLVNTSCAFYGCKNVDPAFVNYKRTTKGSTGIRNVYVNCSEMFNGCLSGNLTFVNYNNTLVRPVINLPFHIADNINASRMFLSTGLYTTTKDENGDDKIDIFFQIDSHLNAFTSGKYNMNYFVTPWQSYSTVNTNITFIVPDSWWNWQNPVLPNQFYNRNTFGYSGTLKNNLKWDFYYGNVCEETGDVDNYNAPIVFTKDLNDIQILGKEYALGSHFCWKCEENVAVSLDKNVTITLRVIQDVHNDPD